MIDEKKCANNLFGHSVNEEIPVKNFKNSKSIKKNLNFIKEILLIIFKLLYFIAQLIRILAINIVKSIKAIIRIFPKELFKLLNLIFLINYGKYCLDKYSISNWISILFLAMIINVSIVFLSNTDIRNIRNRLVYQQIFNFLIPLALAFLIVALDFKLFFRAFMDIDILYNFDYSKSLIGKELIKYSVFSGISGLFF